MTPEKRVELVSAIKQCFFDGMSHGWASGAKAIRDFPFRGARGYEFKPSMGESNRFLGYLTLLDYFFVNSETPTSYGTTVILYCGNPVWLMNYGGWYKEEAIKPVQEALMENYRNSISWGGRGLAVYIHNSKVSGYSIKYKNEFFGDFSIFKGVENVSAINAEETLGIGEHSYSGGLLI